MLAEEPSHKAGLKNSTGTPYQGTVAAITGPEEILDQAIQALIPQPPAQVADKLLFLAWPDVEQLGVRFCLLESRVVFLLGSGAAVVKDDHGGRVPVSPEMLVVLFDCFANIAEPVGRNYEIDIAFAHRLTISGAGAATVLSAGISQSVPLEGRLLRSQRSHETASRKSTFLQSVNGMHSGCQLPPPCHKVRCEHMFEDTAAGKTVQDSLQDGPGAVHSATYRRALCNPGRLLPTDQTISARARMSRVRCQQLSEFTAAWPATEQSGLAP